MPDLRTYPLVLRDGVVVTLRLPVDLTEDEAERIAHYVRTLALPSRRTSDNDA